MKKYFPEEINIMLWPYALKDFSEQLNVIMVDDDIINTMDKFSGTTTDITLRYHHIWGCIVYFQDETFQGNISGKPKWEHHSRAGTYLGY